MQQTYQDQGGRENGIRELSGFCHFDSKCVSGLYCPANFSFGWRPLLSLTLRINWRRQFKPNLDFVAVRIGEEKVRLSRTELALTQNFSTGLCYHLCGRLDIRRIN